MTHGNSSLVSSNQKFATRQIHELLERYQQEFKRPIPPHTEAAFEEVRESFKSSGKKELILDAGCGTGDSTYLLSKVHSDAFVVGIDKSTHRLTREREEREEVENLLVTRADLVSFIQLSNTHELYFQKIYFLYPNPWPKPSQKKRRIHLHPVAPLIAKITREVECRTNWKPFAFEFARVMQLIGFSEVTLKRSFIPEAPLTPFERKYLKSNHKLLRINASQHK